MKHVVVIALAVVVAAPHSMQAQVVGFPELTPLSERATIWRCDTTKKMECDELGCRPNTGMKTWMVIGVDAVDGTEDGFGKYARCDAKGCDDHTAEVSEAGMFTTVGLVGRPGTFLKVRNDGKSFIDVAAIGIGIMLSFGTCTPATVKP